MVEKTFPFFSLPLSCRLHVFSFMTTASFLRTMVTCKKMREHLNLYPTVKVQNDYTIRDKVGKPSLRIGSFIHHQHVIDLGVREIPDIIYGLERDWTFYDISVSFEEVVRLKIKRSCESFEVFKFKSQEGGTYQWVHISRIEGSYVSYSEPVYHKKRIVGKKKVGFYFFFLIWFSYKVKWPWEKWDDFRKRKRIYRKCSPYCGRDGDKKIIDLSDLPSLLLDNFLKK
jgi:hypothetical protein